VPRGLVDLPAASEGASTANPPSTDSVRAGAPCYFIFT